MREVPPPQAHSQAWIVQSWVTFAISVSAVALGVIYLPVNGWTKGYMGMGLAFTVASTFSLAKTTRDLHESKRIAARLDEARVEKLLAEHNPLK